MSARHRHATPRRHSIGNRLAPARFLAFCIVALVTVSLAVTRFGWSTGTMAGFDVAAFVFLLSVVPLLRRGTAETMRVAAQRNDANRAVLLSITVATSLAVLAAVAKELSARGQPGAQTILLVVATLALSWLFANTIYALHYAHVYYSESQHGGDAGGLDFPKCAEPNYWDFLYFSFTLGMTFQTSDVSIESRPLRRIVTLHSLAAFVFNLGILAFTINVLGG